MLMRHSWVHSSAQGLTEKSLQLIGVAPVVIDDISKSVEFDAISTGMLQERGENMFIFLIKGLIVCV